MPDCFLDTNILLRLADPNSPQHLPATRAVAHLRGKGAAVFIIVQNLVEFWAVATRPKEANGCRVRPRASSSTRESKTEKFGFGFQSRSEFCLAP